ncbi:mediator of RNA polymerase II transcription subunit 29 [Centruroides vittatus]|uniref:mediator of RNA polymerase II transcription subunit 29 n=1 Tax=Centruroides vittatus TaxID=120091 RepID=UPI00350F4DBE
MAQPPTVVPLQTVLPQQITPQQQQQQQQQQCQMQSTELKYDNVAKVKSLTWSLKELLVNIMKTAHANITHNAAIDNGLKSTDDSPPRMDKCLEEFFSVCNQIELNLKIVQECTLLQRDSQQYLPLPVSSNKIDSAPAPTQDGTLSYSQYLSTIKSQVSFATAVQEILAEGARKITQGD